MDFSSLPDFVFLRILGYLPFEECVRAGGVNSVFRRISKLAISQTTVLRIRKDLYDDRLTPATLSALVNLCADNIQQFGISNTGGEEDVALVEAFACIRCPNLETFKFNSGGTQATTRILNTVLTNSPKLTALIALGRCLISYPVGITSCERLETLVCRRHDETFRSLTGRVPNLKHLTINSWSDSEYDEGCSRLVNWPVAFDQFLATVPNLETLRIASSFSFRVDDGAGRSSSLDSFWRLVRLTVLEIMGPPSIDGDNSMMKVVNSFPRLRRVRLPTNTRPELTTRGVNALYSLADLRELTLDYPRHTTCISGQCRALAKYDGGSLRKLRFRGRATLSPLVLAELFHLCPQLAQVDLWDLDDFFGRYSPERAALLVESLAGLGGDRRQIRINFHTHENTNLPLWRSTLVKSALKKLKETEGGAVVEFGWPNIDDDQESIVANRWVPEEEEDQHEWA